MIKINDNTWYEASTGLIIERDMHNPKKRGIIRSIHSIGKLEIEKTPEMFADMVMLDLQGASGKIQPRVEDKDPVTTLGQQFKVGNGEKK